MSIIITLQDKIRAANKHFLEDGLSHLNLAKMKTEERVVAAVKGGAQSFKLYKPDLHADTMPVFVAWLAENGVDVTEEGQDGYDPRDSSGGDAYFVVSVRRALSGASSSAASDSPQEAARKAAFEAGRQVGRAERDREIAAAMKPEE